jgi:hypothetical protein
MTGDEYRAMKEAEKQAAEMARPRKEYYTSAPEAYDGFGTLTLEVVGKCRRGNVVRKVSTPVEHFEWQTMRYGSGLHTYTSERCPLEMYVKFGDWTLTD